VRHLPNLICLARIALVLSVIWALYGYSLSFGGDPSAEGAPAEGEQ